MPTLNRAHAPSLAYDFDLGGRKPHEGFVFCHGFASVRGGEKATLLRARAAARGLSFVAFDARGHGASGGAMRDFTLTGYLQDLDDVLAGPARALERVVLVGSSLGGAAALFRAARRPERVAGCVAIAPGLGFARRLADSLPAAEIEAWRRDGVRRARNAWIDVEVGWGFLEDGLRYDESELHASLRTPTLLVHGARDEIVPASVSTLFAAKFPRAGLEILVPPAGDHRLSAEKHMVLDAVERFARRAFGEDGGDETA
jgi:uncharacterized protein